MGELPTASELVATNRTLVVAHRGDSHVAPENTLPAFESALTLGVDMVELDYQHSADGVPIVFHDAELDRTTNAVALAGGMNHRISDWPLARLRKLDAGSWWDARFEGTSLSTLAEALDAICPRTVALVERKSGDAATCVGLLEPSGWLERVVIQAFDWEFLAECHRLAPRLYLAALGKQELSEEKLDRAIASGAGAIAWDNRTLTAGEIAAIHRRGLRAWVWTADDPARILELRTAGIDAIITNRPAQLQHLLAVS